MKVRKYLFIKKLIIIKNIRQTLLKVSKYNVKVNIVYCRIQGRVQLFSKIFNLLSVFFGEQDDCYKI